MEEGKNWEEIERFLKKEAENFLAEAMLMPKEIELWYEILNPLQGQDFSSLIRKGKSYIYGSIGIFYDSAGSRQIWMSVADKDGLSGDTLCFSCSNARMAEGLMNYWIAGGSDGWRIRLENTKALLAEYKKDLRKIMFQIQYPEFYAELEKEREEKEKYNNFLKKIKDINFLMRQALISDSFRDAIYSLKNTKIFCKSPRLAGIREDFEGIRIRMDKLFHELLSALESKDIKMPENKEENSRLTPSDPWSRGECSEGHSPGGGCPPHRSRR